MKRINKGFFRTLFVKQNNWHKYSVLIHTLAVCSQIIKHKEYKMLMAGLLHDIGKPYSAIQKDKEDIENDWYSFPNHEEYSYHIIKNYFFISDYTKKLVRYHYIIRALKKTKEKNQLKKHKRLKRRYDKLDKDFKKDLSLFMKYDDLGKKSFF